MSEQITLGDVMRKRARSAVAAILGITLLCAVPGALGAAAPAQASTVTANAVAIPAWVTFWNQHTERCLDDSFAGKLQVLDCSSSNAQRWYVHLRGDGAYGFESVHTGRCLDDSPTHGLRTNVCGFGAQQRWWVSDWGDLSSEVYNELTEECLDDSFAARLRTQECNASASQSWYGLDEL